MERLSLDQARVAYWREAALDAAANELEAGLLPEQRCDRHDVYAGSALKRDDDIELLHTIWARIVGPGRGANGVLIYAPDWFGDEAVQLDLTLSDITNRLPTAPGEPAFPIRDDGPDVAPDKPDDLHDRLQTFLRAQPFWAQEKLEQAMYVRGLLEEGP